jgi:ribose transport system permease protein
MELWNSWKKVKAKPEFPSVMIFLFLVLVTAILQPNFMQSNVILSNIATFAPLILVSAGQAIIILSGGLDLSVGGSISLINCILASFMTDSIGSVFLALSIAVACAVLIGVVNGFAAGYLKLPPMIATFATSSIWFGLALLLRPQPGGYIPSWAMQIYGFNFSLLSTPLILILLALIIWRLIKRRRLGHYIYSVGSNEFSAYANGINVQKTKLWAYVIGNLFVMLGSMAITCQISSGDAYMGLPYTLTSVASVVIGGISLSGGRGNVLGAVMGALILNLIINLIYFANIPSTYQEFSKGIIIIIALAAAVIYRKKEKMIYR